MRWKKAQEATKELEDLEERCKSFNYLL